MIPSLSEAALRLQARLAGNPDGPQVLFDAWTGREILDTDLPGLIPDTWLYCPTDSPEHAIGADKWITMFERTGFLARPPRPRPGTPLRLFRGATEERSRGMSWTTTAAKADEFRQRHRRYGRTAVFVADVRPEAMLAFLQRPGEGQEVVVDPRLLALDIQKLPSVA